MFGLRCGNKINEPEMKLHKIGFMDKEYKQTETTVQTNLKRHIFGEINYTR